MPGKDRRLALSGIGLVAVVRAGVWVLPFRVMQSLSEKCGRVRGARSGGPTAAEIARAVRLAGRYVPRATCLVQAFAAQILLGRHGHPAEVHIGVALDGKLGFRAHAWVKNQGKVLLGDSEELECYAPMLVLDRDGMRGQPRHI